MKFTKFCLAFLFLSACNSVAPTPTATIEALTSTATATSAPTATPAPTETAVPTPTEVNLENAPYNAPVQLDLKDANGNEIVKGEFVSHMDGKFYGTTYPEMTVIPINFFCKTGVTCPYFHMLPPPSEPPVGWSFSRRLDTMMATRYLEGLSPEQQSAYTPNEYVTKMNNGALPIPFTTSEGDFTYYPSPTHGYNVFYVPWEDTLNDERFVQFDQVSASWRMKKTVDSFGNIVAVIAANKDFSGLNLDLISSYSFVPLAEVIDNVPETMDFISQAIKFGVDKLGHQAYDPSGSPIYGIDFAP